MNKDDFRREVAENFIKLLETDGLSWAKGWSSSTESPLNGASSKLYRGMNAFNLFMTMKMNNWEDPRFFTVKQANSMDREDDQDGSPRIIKGERACHVEYWFVYGRVLRRELTRDLMEYRGLLAQYSADPSFLYPASNLDWRFISYMILYIDRKSTRLNSSHSV